MRGHKKFLALSHAVLILVSILAILPFWLLIMASFTEESCAVKHGYSLIPKEWSLAAYQYLADKWQLFGKGYLITIVVTVAGVCVCVLITLMFSYMLSRPGLPGRKLLTFYVFFTMLFNGGLVSTYIMYSQTFHIKNTLFALIIPNLLTNAFYITMVRNYFTGSIPQELLEAARIDGAGEFTIFRRIGLPLGKSGLLSAMVLGFLEYWNMMEQPMAFLDDKALWPLSLYLPEITWERAGFAFCASIITLIPAAFVFVLGQDYLEQGIIYSGLKE